MLTAAGLCLALALALPHAFSFLSSQSGRGLEYESVGGSMLLAAQHFGYTGRVEFRYGSYEMVGPWVSVMCQVSLAASVLAAGWLVWWRLRARTTTPSTPADAAFAAVLLFVVTSRVISPQYLIWLLGLAAVCLVSRSTVQRPAAALVIAALPLTALEFPIFVNQGLAGHPAIVTVLLLRNLLLLLAASWSCARLWKACPPSTATVAPSQQ